MGPSTCQPSKRLMTKWLEKHNEIVTNCQQLSNIKNVLIGDSIFANFNRPENNDLWNNHFASNSINLSIGGDKIENALWRILNKELPPSARNIFILIGTNNVNINTPTEIAEGVINLVKAAKSIAKDSLCIVFGILPRENLRSSTYQNILETNHILSKSQCFQYITPSQRWIIGNKINPELFWKDNIHLVRNGYVLLARMMLDEINKKEECEKDIIGLFEYLGNGWDGENTNKSLSENVITSDFDSEFPPLAPSCHVSSFPSSSLPIPSRCTVIRKNLFHNVRNVNMSVPKKSKTVVSVVPNVFVTKPPNPPLRKRNKVEPSKLGKHSYSTPCLPSVQKFPLRRLNKVKKPKWEYCDYVPPRICVSESLHRSSSTPSAASSLPSVSPSPSLLSCSSPSSLQTPSSMSSSPSSS